MFSQQSKPRQRSLVSGRRSSFRPLFDVLEDRLAPATHTWTGATSNLWSVATNWTGGAPAVGEADVVLVFQGATNTTNQNDIAGLKVKTIQFNANLFVLSGQAITLTGSIASTNGSGTNAITFDIKLSGNVAVSSVAATTLTLGGILSGTGGMTQTGPATVNLSGTAANTYKGTTRVNGGTLELQKTTGPAIAGPLVIGDGIFAIATPDTVQLQSGFSNQIADTAKITVNSSGDLELNGNSETIGPLTLAGGLVGTGLGTLTLAGNVAAKQSVNSAQITGSLSLGAASRTFSVSSSALLTLSAIITSAAAVSLNKTGSGDLFLNSTGNPGLLGDVNVLGGTLTVDALTSLGGTTAGTTVAKNATLRVNNTNIGNEPLTLSGRGFAGQGALDNFNSNLWSGPVTLKKVAGESNVVINSEVGTLTLSNIISGTAGLIKIGAGDLTLSGSAANTYAGTTRVNAGSLTLNKTAAVAIPQRLIVGDGAGLDSVVLSGSEQIADTALVDVNSSGTLDVNSRTETVAGLSANGGIVSMSSGTFILKGNVGITLPSIISGGTLSLGGATRIFNGAKKGSLSVSAQVIDGTGSAGITKTGAGQLSLTATNTYTGITTVAAGVLSISDNSSLGGLGASARTEVKAGAALALNGGITSTETLTLFGGAILRSVSGGTNVLNGPMTLTALAGKPRVAVQADTAGLDLVGAISGTGGLTKTGAGVMSLGGASGNTYTGTTQLLEGTLELNKSSGNAIPGDLVAGDGVGSDQVTWLASNQIADTSKVLVKSSGLLNLNTFNDTVHALTVLDGGVVLNGTLTVI